MKSSFRYLIGIAAGLAAGFLLPPDDSALTGIITEVTLRLGHYLVLPLIFFSAAVALTRLRRISKLGTAVRRTIFSTLISSAVLTVTGTLAAWFFIPARIPVIPGTAPEVTLPAWEFFIQNILKFNSFQVLTGDGSFVLPLLLPAFLLGWHMFFDKEIAEPAYNFFDSMSRLLYRANSALLLIMPVMLAVLTASAVLKSRQIVDFQRFFPLLVMLGITTLVLVVLVFPLIIRITNKQQSSWKTWGRMFGALAGALISGSPLFNYGNLTVHLKEKLDLPRHSTAFAVPVFLMFARAGTALVGAVCMLTVIRSYSSLEITLFQAAWTALFSFLLSFTIPAAPGNGLAVLMVMTGTLYGRGLDEGWLILTPILPILSMLTALLDTAVSVVLVILTDRRVSKQN